MAPGLFILRRMEWAGRTVLFLPQSLHNGMFCLHAAAERWNQNAKDGKDGESGQYRPEGEAVG